MKKLLFALMILTSGNICAQKQIIDKKSIPKLNSIIKSLEKEYNKSEKPIYKSFPQTTSSYFKIKTKNPNMFLLELKKSKNLKQLENKFPGLQLDKNLLTIKNIHFNYKNEKKIEIKSFEIGNNQSHSIAIKFNDSLDQKHIRYFYYSHMNKKEQITTIRGFYLNEEFKSIPIPNIYSDWIHYTDIIIKPETTIFYDTNEKFSGLRGYTKTIIDSLIGYYETKTNKPPYRKEQDFIARREELEKWQLDKQKYCDSLFKSDKHFKKLLIEALLYAEKNKVSNGDLEDFTAQLISKKRALELIRQHRQVGSCSFDNSPIIQQKRIASLAAQTENWEVFINSFLNVMNDNVSRIANSNIATNTRKTYINELTRLDLNIDNVLLGSNLRVKDTIKKHYFSKGSKIAKAYANLNPKNQHYFEKIIIDIISDKSIDAFNKLHFYNTYKNYQYFIRDSIKKNEIKNNIEKLVPLLPPEVRLRIENPNKQLYELLYREKEVLDKFEIKSSLMAHIGSYSYDGDCWQAELVEKGTNGKIIYDLTMAIEEKITPLKKFIDKKDELKFRINNHYFLQKILNENDKNKLYINFTNDKSFTNHRNRVTEEMPEELTSTLDFKNAISLYISFPNRKYVRFILLNNENLLILGIPKGFELLDYKFPELMTTKEESFLSTTYNSFKLFDKKGRMLN